MQRRVGIAIRLRECVEHLLRETSADPLSRVSLYFRHEFRANYEQLEQEVRLPITRCDGFGGCGGGGIRGISGGARAARLKPLPERVRFQTR